MVIDNFTLQTRKCLSRKEEKSIHPLPDTAEQRHCWPENSGSAHPGVTERTLIDADIRNLTLIFLPLPVLLYYNIIHTGKVYLFLQIKNYIFVAIDQPNYLDGCEDGRHIICRWPPGKITITKKFKKIIFSCHFVSIMIEPSYLTPKLFQLTCFEGCQGIYPHRHRRLGGTFSRQTAQ